MHLRMSTGLGLPEDEEDQTEYEEELHGQPEEFQSPGVEQEELLPPPPPPEEFPPFHLEDKINRLEQKMAKLEGDIPYIIKSHCTAIYKDVDKWESQLQGLRDGMKQNMITLESKLKYNIDQQPLQAEERS
ncbi:hypothetical protein NFI96_003844 [Prochilodus magdalenae]|nr:hypothetical protein NFI96_003844 [Prochilodus magdalenae]